MTMFFSFARSDLSDHGQAQVALVVEDLRLGGVHEQFARLDSSRRVEHLV